MNRHSAHSAPLRHLLAVGALATAAALFQGSLSVGCSTSASPAASATSTITTALRNQPTPRNRSDGMLLGSLPPRQRDYLLHADWRRYTGTRLLQDPSVRAAMTAIAPSTRRADRGAGFVVGVAYAQEMCASAGAAAPRIASSIVAELGRATSRGAAAHTIAAACAADVTPPLSPADLGAAQLACLAAVIAFVNDSLAVAGSSSLSPEAVITADLRCFTAMEGGTCLSDTEPGCGADGPCMADTVRCTDGAFLETCLGDGIWSAPVFCTDGRTCVTGACAAPDGGASDASATGDR